MYISMIAAMTNARVIGLNNTMPWHLPADLKHFKAVTLGKPVIMGRKTYESIGKALPGRKNIVITRNTDYKLADAHTVQSVQSALTLAGAEEQEEVIVIGGGRIYQELLPQAKRLYLTLINADIEGDTYFPNYKKECTWQQVESSHHARDDKNPYDLTFVTLDRVV